MLTQSYFLPPVHHMYLKVQMLSSGAVVGNNGLEANGTKQGGASLEGGSAGSTGQHWRPEALHSKLKEYF